MEQKTDAAQLQNLAESHGDDWGRRFEILLNGADKYFGRISPTESNKNTLLRILGSSDARQAIVKTLEQGEKDWGYDARKDVVLRNVVQSSGVELPKKPKELQRWTMLVAAAASTVEGFSYGNLIRSEDIIRK